MVLNNLKVRLNNSTNMTMNYEWLWTKLSYSELARILFPAESTNNIKFKITHYRDIGDGCIWEVISLMNTCWFSVLSLNFKCSQWWCVKIKENVQWRSNISFKKDTEKVVLLQVKNLIQIIFKFRDEKILCTFLSCTKYHFDFDI